MQAEQQYDVAHVLQYTDKNLREACKHYENLIAQHPESQEAQYSRSQIENIAKSVVPSEVMLVHLLGLIRKHLPANGSVNAVAEAADRGAEP